MRCLVVFVSVSALVALPVSVSAQTEEKEASRLERWHPEAFEDPSKPEPSLELRLDSSSLEVAPSASQTVEERERQEAKQRKRAGAGILIGVLLAAGLIAGVAVGVHRKIDRDLSR